MKASSIGCVCAQDQKGRWFQCKDGRGRPDGGRGMGQIPAGYGPMEMEMEMEMAEEEEEEENEEMHDSGGLEMGEWCWWYG